MNYYAHSGDSDEGITSPQKYETHILNVCKIALFNINDTLKLSTISDFNKSFMRDSIEIASFWHDVGKLDENIQIHLSKCHHTDEKLLNHVDAGIAITLDLFNKTKNTAYLMASVLIHSHHIGLPNWYKIISEKKNQGHFSGTTFTVNNKIRDIRNLFDTYGIKSSYNLVKEYIDDKIISYIKIQHDLLGDSPCPTHNYNEIQLTAMDIRIMFSCLIDADHSDTDEFYSGVNYNPIVSKLDPVIRLNKLKQYIDNLNNSTICASTNPIRTESRNKLFNLCLNHKTPSGMIMVEAPVGTGKTTAVLSTALQSSISNECDRIYNILPYINVISQTVDVYKKSILLDNEDDLNINEIHSKTEFQTFYLRKYSKQWKYPINVSTAVQFFESLIANNTASIRKIHWFSNSTIIFDEYDKAMPHDYWSYILPLLIELHKKYNVHFIFSSGTPIDYFDLYGIDDTLKSEVLSNDDWKYFQKLESSRIKTKIIKRPFNDLTKFYKYLFSKIQKQSANSALIVVNTIINSLLLFELFEPNKYGYKVYQLSSSLTPNDKELILDEIRYKLSKKEKIIVVSTTIIECGVDVSFDLGFKQRSSLSSTLQFNGRVNRNSNNINGTTYIFDFDSNLVNNRTGIFTENPQLNSGIRIFNKIAADYEVSPEYCQEAVRQEIKSNLNTFDFNKCEQYKAFNTISEEFRVINSSTVIIIVDKKIIDRIKSKKYVSATDINRNSIQLWTSKCNKIETIFGGIEQITSENGDIYLAWMHEYDPKFYGIGKMLLDLRV